MKAILLKNVLESTQADIKNNPLGLVLVTRDMTGDGHIDRLSEPGNMNEIVTTALSILIGDNLGKDLSYGAKQLLVDVLRDSLEDDCLPEDYPAIWPELAYSFIRDFEEGDMVSGIQFTPELAAQFA